jgi:hypothetical protein
VGGNRLLTAPATLTVIFFVVACIRCTAAAGATSAGFGTAASLLAAAGAVAVAVEAALLHKMLQLLLKLLLQSRGWLLLL